VISEVTGEVLYDRIRRNSLLVRVNSLCYEVFVPSGIASRLRQGPGGSSLEVEPLRVEHVAQQIEGSRIGSLDASQQAYYYLLDDQKVAVTDEGDRGDWVREVGISLPFGSWPAPAGSSERYIAPSSVLTLIAARVSVPMPVTLLAAEKLPIFSGRSA